jgi:hypothetical protein
MDYHWSIFYLLCFSKGGNECTWIVAVNVTDVLEPEFTNQRTG